jgi:hypothetical protein
MAAIRDLRATSSSRRMASVSQVSATLKWVLTMCLQQTRASAGTLAGALSFV